MEEYAQALHDPKKTLKSIEPIVVQMQQALRGLDEESAHNPGHQDKLARLVNEIAITAVSKRQESATLRIIHLIYVQTRLIKSGCTR
jgi:hypothetical protein